MIKPFGNTLLVERDRVEVENDSGIIMPDSYKDRKLNQGIIRELGTEQGGHLSIGDAIVFNDFAGVEVAYEGIEYLVLPEEDIICILTEDED
tara:strand:+ start:213 stop:488 length:276 start_codon:yes stop_codon:yes gene_type:complete